MYQLFLTNDNKNSSANSPTKVVKIPIKVNKQIVYQSTNKYKPFSERNKTIYNLKHFDITANKKNKIVHRKLPKTTK